MTIILKKEPRLDAKHTAFTYQAEAVEAIKNLEYAAVFHEQGLGKSKIAIDLLLHWLDTKAVDTVLIIAKKGLLHNWQKELATHTHINPKIFSSKKRDNYYVFNSPSRLLLAHFEILKSEEERFTLFLKARRIGVIIDESAKIKNPNSALTKVFFNLAPLFHKRIIMTGTPAANRPYDLWAQIFFLDQGDSLGSDFVEFKRTTDLTNKMCEDQDLQTEFENSISGLYPQIADFSVRETKASGIIQLPQKVIKEVYTDWEYAQHDTYCQLQEEMRTVVIRDGVPTEDNAEQLLKRMLRLVQTASNPALFDDGYSVNPGKFSYLEELIDEICAQNEKCIIWSSFIYNVDWLTRKLKPYGSVKIHGKLNMERRNKSVEQFLNNDQTRIMVATPSAAKEGLTLTVANHVIFYDRSFSLDDYLQAQDRIHRISQDKICYIYNLIMSDSIDEWVDLLLKSKHLAAQLTQGDISLTEYQSEISYDFGTIIKNILGINEIEEQA